MKRSEICGNKMYTGWHAEQLREILIQC